MAMRIGCDHLVYAIMSTEDTLHQHLFTLMYKLPVL